MIKEKTGMYLAYFFQFIILVLTLFALYKGEYKTVLNGLVALIITLIPLIIKRKWNVGLPWTLNLLISLSLAFHVAGLIDRWYFLFYPFYDKIGHFIGSVTVALLGFALTIILDKYSGIKLRRTHILFFIIIFTMALGALWEIGEFLVDVIFKFVLHHCIIFNVKS